jgi:uncharacterized membrane protein
LALSNLKNVKILKFLETLKTLKNLNYLFTGVKSSVSTPALSAILNMVLTGLVF